MADDDQTIDPNAPPPEMTPGQKKFQAAIQSGQDTEISEETQGMLNKPFSDSSTSLSEEDKTFLDNLIKKVESEEIKLLSPSSILNEEVYNSLYGEKQAQADMFINSTLFVIRQVFDFYKSDHPNDSDMMISMVQELRHKKETLEQELGDVLKI